MSVREDFSFEAPLGSGSSGKVWRVRRRSNGDALALKEICGFDDQQELTQRTVLSEVRLLASIRHDNVVGYLESFIEAGSLHIVMELCDGGDLYSWLSGRRGERLEEADVWRVYGGALRGLQHLHSCRILHRDVKSRNIFLTARGGVKLGDLGVARELSPTTALASTLVGTPLYLAPELCEGRPYSGKADVWALGIVLYELITAGRFPFTGSNQAALVIAILAGEYDRPACSEELSVVLHDCLSAAPSGRPSTTQLLTSLHCAGAEPLEAVPTEVEEVAAEEVAVPAAKGSGAGEGEGEGEGGEEEEEEGESLSMLTVRPPVRGSPLHKALARDCRGSGADCRGRGRVAAGRSSPGGGRGRDGRGPPPDMPVTFRKRVASSGYGISPVMRLHDGGAATQAARARKAAATKPPGRARAVLDRTSRTGVGPPTCLQAENTLAVAPLGGPLLRTAFAPDGCRLALAGADGSVALLRMPPRRHPSQAAGPPSLNGHRAGLLHSVAWRVTREGPPLVPPGALLGPPMAFHRSHSGKLLLSASADGSACLWDVQQAGAATAPLLHFTHVSRPPPPLRGGASPSGSSKSSPSGGGERDNPPLGGEVRAEACASSVLGVPSRLWPGAGKAGLLLLARPLRVARHWRWLQRLYHAHSTHVHNRVEVTAVGAALGLYDLKLERGAPEHDARRAAPLRHRYSLAHKWEVDGPQHITCFAAAASFLSPLTIAAGSDRSLRVLDWGAGRAAFPTLSLS